MLHNNNMCKLIYSADPIGVFVGTIYQWFHHLSRCKQQRTRLDADARQLPEQRHLRPGVDFPQRPTYPQQRHPTRLPLLGSLHWMWHLLFSGNRRGP